MPLLKDSCHSVTNENFVRHSGKTDWRQVYFFYLRISKSQCLMKLLWDHISIAFEMTIIIFCCCCADDAVMLTAVLFHRFSDYIRSKHEYSLLLYMCECIICNDWKKNEEKNKIWKGIRLLYLNGVIVNIACSQRVCCVDSC